MTEQIELKIPYDEVTRISIQCQCGTEMVADVSKETDKEFLTKRSLGAIGAGRGIYPLIESMPVSLKYKGPLPSGGRKAARSKEKQFIRHQLNMQIANFMEKPPPEVYGLSTADDRVSIGNFVFQPIVCKGRGISCELDVKISSRVPFGSVYHQGDLDNRIKTLFDALCVPNEDQLAKGDYPASRTLFWILLQDDSLITDFCVKTERLLTPGSDSEVEVDIAVTIKRPESLFR